MVIDRGGDYLYCSGNYCPCFSGAAGACCGVAAAASLFAAARTARIEACQYR